MVTQKVPDIRVSVLFSEPKIPQFCIVIAPLSVPKGFSALQRAENSSIMMFLDARATLAGFSALQRAENSSMYTLGVTITRPIRVSVLFSEPKIPQFGAPMLFDQLVSAVSVLFSEPKIPQSTPRGDRAGDVVAFQCSSASRKFLNGTNTVSPFVEIAAFQCSSASRKFLNFDSIAEEGNE